MEVKEVTLKDDLSALIEQISQASWDEANDISESDYDLECLKAYLERQDTLFMVCLETTEQGNELLGIASARIEMKPYAKEFWLYVDEVDVCAGQRQRGIGKRIMGALLQIAKERGCSELWLATEVDNLPANALYHSLKPDDVSTAVGFTYRTDSESPR